MKSTAPKDTDTDKDLELAIEVPTPSTNGVVRQHQPHNSEIDHGDGDVYEESAEKEEKEEGEGQGTVVDWGGPNDPQNPLNWPPIKKRVNFGIIAVITFLSPLASSMFAPGVRLLMQEFKSSSEELASFSISSYVLGYALGPLMSYCWRVFGGSKRMAMGILAAVDLARI